MSPALRWTREKVISALRAWFATYGEVPTSGDWSVAYLRKLAESERLDRYLRLSAAGLVPTRSTVQKKFGTWEAALEAAGLPPIASRRRVARCSKGHNDWVEYAGRRACRICKNDSGRRRRAMKTRGLLLGPREQGGGEARLRL